MSDEHRSPDGETRLDWMADLLGKSNERFAQYTDFEKEMIYAYHFPSSKGYATLRTFWSGYGATLDLEALADRRKRLPMDAETLLAYLWPLYGELYDQRYQMDNPEISDDRLALLDANFPGIAKWYRKRIAETTILEDKEP